MENEQENSIQRTQGENEEQLRVFERREFVRSLSGRGLGPAQIVRMIKKDKPEYFDGITDPYQTVCKDIRIAKKLAYRIRALGDQGIYKAEADYLHKLSELFTACMVAREYNIARQVLHDIARIHGINVEEPTVIDARQIHFNRNQSTVNINANESASIEEVRANIAILIEEINTLGGIAAGSVGTVPGSNGKGELH